MQEVEVYPRYLAHQLRTHLPATVVGRLVEMNDKKRSLLLETDPEGTNRPSQLKWQSRPCCPTPTTWPSFRWGSTTRCEARAEAVRSWRCEGGRGSVAISVVLC